MAAPEPVDLSFVTTDVWGGSVLQWADQFTDVKDLVDKAIAKLKPGECIRRLVIAGHGADHTDGFFVFDPDTSGAQLIDGGTKREPISPSVVTQLQRLKPYFCKDAIIEFRVCRFGEGKNGEAAMQAVADAVGVAVTAPMGSISSLAAIGGLATDWRVAYPKIWGVPTSTSFWRGSPTQAPPGAPSPAEIAPTTGQVVPLRTVTSPPPPRTLPPVRRLSIAEREDRRKARRKRLFGSAGALAVGGGLAAFGAWLLLNSTPPGPGVGLASPSVPPTATPVAATPTVAPTASRTAAPTASPTPQPTPTPITIILPADGTYFGSGMFRSYDGQESYQTSWRVIKTTGTVEIAQLLSPGGSPYQVLEGIVDPSGLFVAVSDDPNYCEVIVLESDATQLANDMFVAYGPSSMTCPGAQELADFYLTLILGPEEHEIDFRSQYSWGNDVVIGSVLTDWTAD